MDPDKKIFLREGDRSDLPESRTAGQLLFATYDDLLTTKGGTVRIKQGDIYLDTSDGTNGVRINLANDVDKARTLFSGATLTTNNTPGDWEVDLEGIQQLYDGLTIAIRINGRVSNVYNTLEVNGLGAKLVWLKSNEILTDQFNTGAELLLTYRVQASSDEYTIQAGGPGSLTVGSTHRDGWVVNGIIDRMHVLTLGGRYYYDGSTDISVPLGTIITLKTWE